MSLHTTASRWQSKHALAEIGPLSLVASIIKFFWNRLHKEATGGSLAMGHQDIALGALDNHRIYFLCSSFLFTQRGWSGPEARCYFMSQ